MFVMADSPLAIQWPNIAFKQIEFVSGNRINYLHNVHELPDARHYCRSLSGSGAESIMWSMLELQFGSASELKTLRDPSQLSWLGRTL